MCNNSCQFLFQIYEFSLTIFFQRFDFDSLVLKHLNGFTHSKLDGGGGVPHVMDHHAHEDFIVFQLTLEFLQLFVVNVPDHRFLAVA